MFVIAWKGNMKLRPLNVSNKKVCKVNDHFCAKRPHKNFQILIKIDIIASCKHFSSYGSQS